jgi:hypothetical protein
MTCEVGQFFADAAGEKSSEIQKIHRKRISSEGQLQPWLSQNSRLAYLLT